MGKKTKSVNKSKATGTGAVPDAALVKGLQEQGSLLPLLRLQWSLAGKDEWWWVMDDSVAEIARQIKTKNYCVFDGFLGPERSALLERDVKEVSRWAGTLARTMECMLRGDSSSTRASLFAVIPGASPGPPV